MPDGQTRQYHYHESGPNRGQLQSISRGRWGGLSEEALVRDIDLDARDGASGYASAAGIVTQQQYSANGQIRSVQVGSVLDLQYTVDSGGRIVGLTENGDEQRFAYSANGLMVADTMQGLFSYGYDNVGNRTSRRVRQAGELTEEEIYRYAADGEGNRLLERIDSVAGVMQPYTYSATGAPVQRGRLRYEYDAKDQLSALYRDERLLARYAYNGFGERIRKVVYSQGKRPTVTYYLYSNSTLVAEADESGRITAQYQYLEDHRPVLMLQGKQAYVIHTDHLGTPRVVSDEQGSIRWQASYTPFGKAIITQADIDLPLRFPGQYADAESGTHYNDLRDYDPQLGRYLRSDPIGLGGGLNTYAYVAGNPLGAIDPLGLFQLPSAGSPLWNFIQQNNLQNQAYLANTPASQPVPPPQVGVPATTVLRGLARAHALFKIADALYTVGYVGAAVTDAIFTRIDHDDLVAQIQRYVPGYVARGKAAQVNAEGIRALGNDLYAAQLDLIAQSDSACVVDQLLFDAQWAVGGGAQISNEIKAQIREQYEQQYLSYQANGGTGSFEDWLAEGMPEDDAHTSLSVFRNQQPENLQQELDHANSIGVHPVSPTDPEFAELVDSGVELIWSVDEEGNFMIAPNEVNHTVLTEGRPVLSAGEISIVADGSGGYVILMINNQSGHYLPSEESLEVAKEILNDLGFRYGF